MDEAKIASFKGKVIRGTIALTTRTFLNQAISFAGNFALTIILAPGAFGIFFVVSAAINFLNYFSDIGLAAALVQMDKEPSREELVTVFTLQEIIVIAAVVIALFLSGLVADFYSLTPSGLLLFRALVVAFFLASLKTIPSILLERRLDFSLLIFPQVLENIVFFATAVIMAYMKMDVLSFAFASLFRGIVGVIAIYWICPWKPGLGFSFAKIRHLINFGIPFQLNSLLALVKDDLLTLYLGKVMPFSSLGLLGWAKKQSEVPLRLIMDSVIRVTFPAFSRIQQDRGQLKSFLGRTVFMIAVFVLPISALMLIYIKPLIFVIPKYTKWLPAVPAFYFFAASAMLSAFSSPLVNALNALGKIRRTLLLMVFWTVLTWVLVPLLTYFLGIMGWPVAALLISSTIFIPVYVLKGYVPFSFMARIRSPLLITLLMSAFSCLTLPYVSNFYSLAASIGMSLALYGIVLWKIHRNDLKPLPDAALKRE